MLLNVLAAAVGGAAVASTPPTPHIVFILADDFGYQSVHHLNAPDVVTPNIDRLLTEGVRVERYYAHSTCGPSRVALMTGRFAFHLPRISSPQERLGLPLEYTPLPQRLKSAGYTTASIYPPQPAPLSYLNHFPVRLVPTHIY